LDGVKNRGKGLGRDRRILGSETWAKKAYRDKRGNFSMGEVGKSTNPLEKGRHPGHQAWESVRNLAEGPSGEWGGENGGGQVPPRKGKKVRGGSQRMKNNDR